MDIIVLVEIFVTVFILNVNPLFTIPTWIVVAFFAANSPFNSIVPMILIGISASAIGRYFLSQYSRKIGEKALSKRQKRNIEYLKEFFVEVDNPRIAFVISFLYALSPLPTNALFLLAGVANLKLYAILGGFFLGELLSNIVYLTVLETAIERVTFSVFEYFLIGVFGIIIAAAVFLIDWRKVIKTLVKRELEKKSHEAIREMFK
ncbi:MAG: VTT domain-containing protein [Candidatus Micrarchaeota archaeon]|nr:VTT domain-containing protein [Candidatus Micrarchaeota archaeon]